MITVTQSVDIASQTVTWKVDETPPGYDIDGVMCHAMDEEVDAPHIRHILAVLGYRLWAAHVNQSAYAPGYLTLYWAKR